MPGASIIRLGDRRAVCGSPVVYPYICPRAASSTRVVADEAPSAAAGARKALTIANSLPDPTCPRMLSYAVTTDADEDLTARFEATLVDWWGQTVYETITGVTLAGGAVLGSVPVRSVTSIHCITDTAAAVDAADRVAVGIGAHFGVMAKIKETTDVIAGIACADPATSAVHADDLTAGGAVTMADATRGYAYYTPNDAPDGLTTWYWLHVQSTYGGVK